MRDNRDYTYKGNSITKRPEYSIILDLIPDGSKVVDMGSGDGSLLYLLKKKDCSVIGVEQSKSGVKSSRLKKIKTLNIKIDQKLPFKNKAFDYAICNATIQMLMYPERLLEEMKRISRYQIISFPNFGFIINRIELLFLGRMPKFGLFGYEWFSTGHIHQLSIKDFRNVCKKLKLIIVKSYYFLPLKPLTSICPNIFAINSVFLTKDEK